MFVRPFVSLSSIGAVHMEQDVDIAHSQPTAPPRRRAPPSVSEGAQLHRLVMRRCGRDSSTKESRPDPPGRGGDITQRRCPRPGIRTRDRHPRSQRDQTGKARRRRSRGRRSIRGEGGLRSRRLTVGKRTGGRTGRRGEPLRMGGGEIGRRGPEWRCRVRVYVMLVSGVY